MLTLFMACEITLFSRNADIVTISYKSAVAQRWKLLILDQRCKEWSVLRQFRLTSTNSGIFLNRDKHFLQLLGQGDGIVLKMNVE